MPSNKSSSRITSTLPLNPFTESSGETSCSQLHVLCSCVTFGWSVLRGSEMNLCARLLTASWRQPTTNNCAVSKTRSFKSDRAASSSPSAKLFGSSIHHRSQLDDLKQPSWQAQPSRRRLVSSACHANCDCKSTRLFWSFPSSTILSTSGVNTRAIQPLRTSVFRSPT